MNPIESERETKARTMPSTDTLAATVLVVDDHRNTRESMADILRCAGHETSTAPSAVDALQMIDQNSRDVIVTDLRMPGMSGLDFIKRLNQRGVDSQVVMITAHASVDSAVEAMRHGAFDYIEKPINADQLENVVERAVRQAEPRSSIPAQQPVVAADPMIGESEPMKQLKTQLARIAATDETVLITGESGVGKELVARAIHSKSNRAQEPLVSMNCPALSPQLMESELFGHVRGAFTSADAPRVGRFELADKGTIFLDEITEIDTVLQAKLLRVLQERCYERVGDSHSKNVDVRVVATTNRCLQTEVTANRFRQDLYFRLNVVPLHVPPLRERGDDVLLLASHFSRQTANRLQCDPLELRPDAQELLRSYHWPGNVRELENLITRTAVLNEGGTVSADELRPWLIESESSETPNENSANETLAAGMSLQDMERQLIEATLKKFDAHREKTAKALGIGVRTLTNKLRSYGYAPRAKSPTKAA